MNNSILFRKMVNDYNALAYTHNYIFGYTHKGIVYAVHADSEILPYVCTLDSASRGAGYSLRFKPNKAQKETFSPPFSVPLNISTLNCPPASTTPANSLRRW